MNHIDALVDVPRVHLTIYEELAAEYDDMFSFNAEEFLEMPEPWAWPWKTPLRALQEQIIGRPDVTAWTTRQADELARVLDAPAEEHVSLLGFREGSTELLPAVTDAGLFGECSEDPTADPLS